MPQDATIHSWTASQVDTNDLDLLSSEEVRRLRAMRNPDAARLFIASRTGMRQRLAERLQLSPAAVRIDGGAGQPLSLPDCPGLHLSLSHSRESIVLAVSSQPVGVDVEFHKAHRDVRELARRVYDPREAEWVCGAEQDPQALDRFYGIWTLKEAALKQQGKGMSYPCRLPAFVEEQQGTLQAVGAPGAGSCWRWNGGWVSVVGSALLHGGFPEILWKLRPES